MTKRCFECMEETRTLGKYVKVTVRLKLPTYAVIGFETEKAQYEFARLFNDISGGWMSEVGENYDCQIITQWQSIESKKLEEDDDILFVIGTILKKRSRLKRPRTFNHNDIREYIWRLFEFTTSNSITMEKWNWGDIVMPSIKREQLVVSVSRVRKNKYPHQ